MKPRIRPGQVLLAATSGDAATLWVLGAEGADVELGSEAVEAWNAARTAVLNRLPLLWASPRGLTALPKARKVGVFVPKGACEHPVTRLGGLDGKSFGLGFVLAQASALYGLAVEPRLAALAAVDAGGSVRPVADVSLKTQAIVRKAEWVQTLLVAPPDEDEAREAAWATSIRVEPIQTIEQALDIAFEGRPAERLRYLVHEVEGRRRVVSSLFEMALLGDKTVLNWKPVAEAASLAVASVQDPAADEAFRLNFARAVALRHQFNRGDLPVPEEAVLRALPAPVRVRLVAHLVQHSADTGQPPPEETERLARGHLVRGREAFEQHLILLGALGRLLAVVGRPEEALQASTEAAEGLVERMAWAEVSHPLCMALRLAGVVGRGAVLDRMGALMEDLRTRGVLSGRDLQFIRLARAAGRVFLAAATDADRRDIESLADDRSAPSHVRVSAMRLAVRATQALHRPDPASGWRDRLQAMGEDATLSEEERREARLYAALSVLDDCPDDAVALARLRDLDPGVVGSLERAAARLGEPVGPFVARNYPY